MGVTGHNNSNIQLPTTNIMMQASVGMLIVNCASIELVDYSVENVQVSHSYAVYVRIVCSCILCGMFT